ncbi:hypothetical protein XENOCAPTIV_016256, partial [Xenoophorus captivus]
ELSGNEEEEPALKKRREQLQYMESEEFQKILNAKSRHGAEYQLQERYFNVLVKKEQMEEKMKGIREMKCRAVTCKKVHMGRAVREPLLQTKEKTGPKIGGELLQPRGEEHAKFLNSLK